MWQVAQLMLVPLTSLKNSIWPSRRSLCSLFEPNAPGNEVVSVTAASVGSAGLTSTVDTEVVNWFTTYSVSRSQLIARPRGPLCRPIGLFVEQQSAGTPSIIVGQPLQPALLMHGAPGLLVNDAQTLLPKPPMTLLIASV